MAAASLAELESYLRAEAPALLTALQRGGVWRPAPLAFLVSAEDWLRVDEALRLLLPDAGGDDDDDYDFYAPYLIQAVTTARREFVAHHRGLLCKSTWELAATAHARTLEEERNGFEDLFRRRQLHAAQAQVPPATTRLRATVFARAVAKYEGDPHGREKAEADYRGRMLDRLQAMMVQDGLDAGTARLVAAGRRASTLDTRLRAWAAFQRWLGQAGGRSVPLSPQDLIDYLAARAAEPCGRGTLRGVMAMFGFLDDVYRRQGDDRWTRDKSVNDAFNEYGSSLTVRAEGAPAVKALRPPVGVLAALERTVVDGDRNSVDRVLSWYMLTAAWGTLRFDDHRGWPSGQLAVDDGGWDVGLQRTKTTGRGKKVEVRPLSISKESWLVHENWFITGFRLLQAEAPFSRDYLLPVPGASSTFKPRELRYEEYVGRMRWILSGLLVSGDVLGEEAAMGITAHSWRSFVPSAAAAIGITKELIDALPAWGAQGGEGYVRTARQRSRFVQTAVARAARQHSAEWDVFASGDDIPDLTRKLMQRGLTAENAERKAGQWLGHVGAYRGPLQVELAIATPQPSASSTDDSLPQPPEPTRKRARMTDQRRHLPHGVKGYVISMVGRQRTRRLHYLGACHRVPGIDYLEYYELGMSMPDEDTYDLVCRNCWPSQVVKPLSDNDGATTEEEADSMASDRG